MTESEEIIEQEEVYWEEEANSLSIQLSELQEAMDESVEYNQKLATDNFKLINQNVQLFTALKELVCTVKMHSEATNNNFAWAELEEAELAIKAVEKNLIKESK